MTILRIIEHEIEEQEKSILALKAVRPLPETHLELASVRLAELRLMRAKTIWHHTSPEELPVLPRLVVYEVTDEGSFHKRARHTTSELVADRWEEAHPDGVARLSEVRELIVRRDAGLPLGAHLFEVLEWTPANWEEMPPE